MDCIDRVLCSLRRVVMWAVGVSGVYVKAVVPFRRVLAISRPLTQLTQGIMGIKERDCVTLASHCHSSINASQQGCGFCLDRYVLCV